jgi:hypothetical protein
LESRVDGDTARASRAAVSLCEKVGGAAQGAAAPAAARPTASLLTGDDGLERAADPLHRRDVDAKPFGKNPHAGAPRSRQRLTDSFCERRGNRGPAKPLPLVPSPGPGNKGPRISLNA